MTSNNIKISRLNWELPLITDKDGPSWSDWLKFLACLVFIYCLYNTKNPFIGFFRVSQQRFYTQPNHWLVALFVLGYGAIMLGLVGLACYWLVGRNQLRKLFIHLRGRDIFAIIGFGLLFYLLMTASQTVLNSTGVASNMTPYNLLSDAQSYDQNVFFLLTGQQIFIQLAQQLQVVMIYLLLSQVFRHYFKETNDWRGQVIAMAGAAIFYGLLQVNEYYRVIGVVVVIYGLAEIAALLAYRYSRNVAVMAGTVLLVPRLLFYLVYFTR